MQEIFKDIPNYEGMYQVSNLGRVKSLERKSRFKKGFKIVNEKILNPQNDSYGYLSVTLSKNGITKTIKVHKLVAISFLNHDPNGYKIVIDHIDNNKLNNNLDNLQLISQRENTSKDKKEGTSKYVGVHWHKTSKKWRSSIRINGKIKHLGRFINEYDAHLAYQKELSCIKN